jgi:hypothetical protein
MGADQMIDEAGEHAFKRSPALAVASMLWGLVFVVVGASNLSNGLVPVVFLIASAPMLVNSWWCWRVPYVRMDGDGLAAYPSIVSRPRTVAWADVEHVQVMGDGRLYLVGPGAAEISIRMKTVSMDERAALVDEVQRRSGKRLRRTPAKPSKRR